MTPTSSEHLMYFHHINTNQPLNGTPLGFFVSEPLVQQSLFLRFGRADSRSAGNSCVDADAPGHWVTLCLVFYSRRIAMI